MGQTGRSMAGGGERRRGTATYGGKWFKERARLSDERPIRAASFRQQSIQASCPPPPLWENTTLVRATRGGVCIFWNRGIWQFLFLVVCEDQVFL